MGGREVAVEPYGNAGTRQCGDRTSGKFQRLDSIGHDFDADASRVRCAQRASDPAIREAERVDQDFAAGRIDQAGEPRVDVIARCEQRFVCRFGRRCNFTRDRKPERHEQRNHDAYDEGGRTRHQRARSRIAAKNPSHP